MKSITKRIISTLAICGALVLEAGATAIGSLGKALNNIAKVDAAEFTVSQTSFSFTGGDNVGPFNLNSDSNITWEAHKGTGTTAIANSNSTIRIYKPSSGNSLGGYVAVKALNDCKIKSITFTIAADKASAYTLSVDDVAGSSTSFTNKGTNATKSDISASEVRIYDSGSERMGISGISVTYSMTSTKEITGLRIANEGSLKKKYDAGQSFDSTGMTVYASWDGVEDTSKNVASDIVWTPDPLVKGTTKVTGYHKFDTEKLYSVEVSGISVLSADTTITQSNWGISTTSKPTSEGPSTVTIDGVTYHIGYGYKYNSNMSFNPSYNGYIANNTAYSKYISKVVVTYADSNGQGRANFYACDEAKKKDATNIISGSADGNVVTYDLSSGEYQYWMLAQKTTGSSNYINIVEIDIYLGEEVKIPAKDVSISSNDFTISNKIITLPLGTAGSFATGDLIATVTPSDASDKTVSWESSNTTKASVENGSVSIDTSAVASYTITVYANGADVAKSVSDTVTFEVVDTSLPTLTSVIVGGTPVTPQYEGKNFNYAGLTFTPVYDKTVEEADKDVIDPSKLVWSTLQAGVAPTASYTSEKYNGTVLITVNDVSPIADYVTDIKIVGNLSKTTYYATDSWSTEGIHVEGHYASDSSTYVTISDGINYSFDPIKPELGVESVTITARVGETDITANSTYSVSVEEKQYASGIIDGAQYIIEATFKPNDSSNKVGPFVLPIGKYTSKGSAVGVEGSGSSFKNDATKAWTFTSTGVDDEWFIHYNDGETEQYLNLINDNNGVRSNPESTAKNNGWKFSAVLVGETKLVINLKDTTNNRYLTAFSTPDFRCYTGTTSQGEGSATITLTKYEEPATYDSLEVSATTTSGWKVGQSPNLSQLGATVKAVYSSGDKKDVTSSATITSGLPLVKGDNTVTVSYTEESTKTTHTSSITVNAVQPVTAISMNTYSGQMNFSATQELSVSITPNDANNKQITWESSNDSIATVSADLTDSTKATVTAGTTVGDVKITAKTNDGSNLSATADIHVNDPTVHISGISISGTAEKTEYFEGEIFDPKGLSVLTTVSSGSGSDVVNDVEWTPNPLTFGTTQVTASYTCADGTFTDTLSGIVVKKDSMTKLNVSYTGTSPILGDEFIFDGTITASWANPETEDTAVELTDVEFSDIDKFTLDSQTITVTHKTTGVTGTFNISYSAKSYDKDPVPVGTVLWAEDFSGFKKDDVPQDSNASTTVYNDQTLKYTCVNGEASGKVSVTKIYEESIGGGTSPELLVGKNVGSFKIEGIPTANAKEMTLTYKTNKNLTLTTTNENYQVSGSNKNWTVTLINGKTASSTIDLLLSSASSDNSRLDDLELKISVAGDKEQSQEKHVIRIADITCSKSDWEAGESISKDNFTISVQYDTGVELTSNLKPTSIDKSTLVAGENIITLSFTDDYENTVTETYSITTTTTYAVSFTGDEFAVITTDLEDDYKMIEGEDYEILLKAQEKCVITKVTVDGVEQDPEVDGSYDIVIEDASKDVAIVIEGYQKFALSTSGTGVTFNTDDLEEDGTMHSGGNYTFTVAANDGYKITKIDTTGDGVEVSGNTITVTGVSSDVSISVTTVKIYAVAVTGNTSCVTVTGLPEDGKMVAGEDYTITITKNTDCVIDGVTVNGSSIAAESDGSYKVEINDASEAVSIVVTAHGLAMFDITDSTDTYATLSNTATQVKEGTTYESDVTFATGKELDTVSVTMGGVEVTGAYSNGHIKVENVSGDLVISITSKDVYFDVEYNFNHVSGVAISPETSLPEKVVYNGSVSFKVEPESGYAVDTGHIMVKEDGAAKTFSYDSTTGILTVSNVTNALEIAIDAFKLAEVTKDLGDGLSISHESSPVSINNSYTLELSLADGKEITSVSVKMGGEPVDDAWNASTLTVYIATVTDDIEIKIETKTIQVPINANGNITVDPEVKDYGSESVTVTVSPKEGYVITENSLYYTIGDDDTHHTITGNSFVIDSLTEEINVYGETIAVYNLSYDLTDLTHSEADPYIQKDLDTFEIVLEVDGDKSMYGIDMTTFKVEMGGEDITGDITKVVYTHDKANGKLTINLVVSELTGDIKVTAARGPRLFDVSVTGQTDLVDVTGDLEIAYDSTGSITFTPADHYHFEANGIQVVNSGSAEVLLDSQPDGSVILHFLTGVKGDVSITVAVVHDLVSVTTGTLEHITFDFTTVEHENIEYGTAVTGHFTAEFGYERPISITVTCYGELLEKTDYAYNQATGVFSIYAMGDIVISAKGTQGQVEVVATGDEHVSFNDGEGLPAITDSGLPFIATVEAEEGYKISSIVVTMNGSEVPNAYNEATGTITIQSVNDKINIAVTTVKLHSVEYDIENVTISDHIYEVVDNGTYTLIILVNDGYELKNGAVSVTMGGEDVTGDVLGEGVIFISQVTGDVQVSIKATKKSFSVTNTLTNASNSNAAITSVEYGASYQAVISALEGYENLTCTVKMGGVDVPCVNGVIIISKVTGAIEITASAVASKVNVSVDVTNVTCTIDSQQVDYNSSLEFTLTQDDNTFDYVYSVTMGGEPVDGLNGVYTIEHVTGDVVITASATEIVATGITATLDDDFKVVDYDSEFPIGRVTVVVSYNDGSTSPYDGEITFSGYNKAQYGIQSVTISAAGFTTSVEIEVLKSIVVQEVTDISTYEASYDFGYNLTIEDIIVFYDTTDGLSHADAPDEIVEGSYDITISGNQNVQVRFDGQVYDVLVHINASTEIKEISAAAKADSYDFGYALKASDFTVLATYTDGLTATINAEYIEFDGKAGVRTVIVHAAGLTDSVEVTINASTVIESISAVAKADSYEYGHEMQVTDFTVTATYTDGHTATIDATKVEPSSLASGLNVVTVTASGKTCTVVVKVNDSEVVDSISAVIKDGKETVAYEGAFTADDVTVYATYTDGKTKVVSGFTMSGFDNKHIGVNTVTITLGDKTCTVKVTVLASAVVDHIEAVATKDNLTYGDSFTKDDVKVTEVYTDGHKVENLAADSISGFTGKVGVNNVTVVYGDKEASIQVTVKASEVIECIEAVVNEGKAELEYGAAFTKDDVTVTATYTDGHTAVVAADSVDFAGTVGENTVVVHIGDKTCEVKVTVKASEVITGIEVSTEKTNVEYGGTFTKDDVKAQYVYSDGHKVDATVDSISGFSATTLGKQVITVKVGEYSATLEITVSGRVALSIEVIGYNDTVDQGKDYVFTGKVIAHYNDGTTEEVTAYTMEAVDTSKAGKKTVKVSFENVSATFDINVIQTKTEIEPTYMTAIIGGSVVGVAILAVGIFLFLKSFKL